MDQVDLVFYDISDCFNSLWVPKTLVDLYSKGVHNNAINLLHEMSKNNLISIKTPVGETDFEEIEEIIMQGESISGTLCTTTMG